eukprot:CAMPEP_0113308708 /NCGR_PEP_ID=MMETSP0010_2-20120614/7048_1 /TAXON_ID=216773 ORGANISM="Corethron hystrix, Strain 308" /NCGR_SAMPLE_ID=MMETSP0010_2 /ASSEMBLY_ACC=CAM_ASM_000155 /LENGTH=540 /DNA_ID=CAMNT_0000163823 /DNA_START=47 /DNA_END=1669 /DNA_ORIENTATION=+ /assembly_acc=CAM_ASM_000155
MVGTRNGRNPDRDRRRRRRNIVLIVCTSAAILNFFSVFVASVSSSVCSAFSPGRRTIATRTTHMRSPLQNTLTQRLHRQSVSSQAVSIFGNILKITTDKTHASSVKLRLDIAAPSVVQGRVPPVSPDSVCVSLALNEAVYRMSIAAGHSNMTLEVASDLVRLGAVWWRTASDGEGFVGGGDGLDLIALLQKIREADNFYDGDYSNDFEDFDIPPVPPPSSGRYSRITSPSAVNAVITSLRIHASPRRFPSASNHTILHEDGSFVIADKPPMCPVQPDASNYLECTPGIIGEKYGPFQSTDEFGEVVAVDRPLICHRVDSCVGGVVVLAKNRNAQGVFSRLQRERKVKKLYRAVTSMPVPLGLHVHYMWSPVETRDVGARGGPARRQHASPCQLLSREKRKGKDWIRCVLEVVRSNPIKLSPKHNEVNSVADHFECTIRLVTGRKHQVRAQLSALGCPIVGDSLYQPIAGMTLDGVLDDNSSDRLGNIEREIDDDAESALARAIERCCVPVEPIGLQAHAIMFGGVKVVAKDPWWSTGMER